MPNVPVIWRVAGSAPVVFVGEPGTVRFLEDQLEAQIGSRQRLQVDLWLRDEAGVPGQRYQMKKEAMLVLHGVGDIERGRVCTVAPPIVVADGGIICQLRNSQRNRREI